MQENNWKITTIKTDDWAKGFAQLLEQETGKTYFLQGKWGSGKTEYLKKVEKLTKDKLKFVYLKLWKPKNNKSLAKQLFSTVFPNLDCFLTLLSWIAVLIMIVGSVSLALTSLFPVNTQYIGWLAVAIIATIVTTLFNLVKNKVINVDDILFWLSINMLQRKRCQPIVLIVDDFDRIDAETQKEMYKVFNAIQEKNGNARIIFVGDYENIQKVKDNYLSKIIDQIVALPFVLGAQSFAPMVEKTISKNLNENLSGSRIKDLFISENRTLRDANQFLTYVKGEFCNQKKKGRVQTDQQLYIIYLYLFHKKHYKKLYEGWFQQKEGGEILLQSHGKQLKNKDNGQQSNSEDKIDKYTKGILSTNEKYPKEYQRNQSAYFINEFSTNHSISELIDFVENKTEALRHLTFSEKSDSDNYYPELIDFLRFHSSDGYFKEIRTQLCKAAFFAMSAEPRHEPNDLIKTILNKATYSAMTEMTGYAEPITKIDISFKKICQEAGYKISLTSLIYIYRTCFQTFYIPDNLDNQNRAGYVSKNRSSLSSIYFKQAEEIINKEDFGQHAYDAEALLALLWFDPENTETLNLDNPKQLTLNTSVDRIEQLCDTEYIAFWDSYLKVTPEKSIAKTLNFYYKGQKYANLMRNRYAYIEQTVFSCFDSTAYSKLDKFFKSDKWVYFILRIIDKAGLNNPKYIKGEKYLLIRSEIDKLLRAYNENSKEKQLHVMEDAYSEEMELKVMQDLLEEVELDPNWTKKLDIYK